MGNHTEFNFPCVSLHFLYIFPACLDFRADEKNLWKSMGSAEEINFLQTSKHSLDDGTSLPFNSKQFSISFWDQQHILPSFYKSNLNKSSALNTDAKQWNLVVRINWIDQELFFLQIPIKNQAGVINSLSTLFLSACLEKSAENRWFPLRVYQTSLDLQNAPLHDPSHPLGQIQREAYGRYTEIIRKPSTMVKRENCSLKGTEGQTEKQWDRAREIKRERKREREREKSIEVYRTLFEITEIITCFPMKI